MNLRRFALVLLFFPIFSWAMSLSQALDEIPIQNAGRIKPFSTFAQESLQLIYGKSKYNGKDATEIVFTWILIPDQWMNTPIIELRHAGLKEALKIEMPASERHITAQALFANERVPLILQELNTLRGRQEKLNPYYQAVQRLESQLGLFQAIRSGEAIRLVPDPESDTWKSVPELEGEMREAFTAVARGFVDSIVKSSGSNNPQASPELETAVREFMDKAKAQAPEKYADMEKISLEHHLNRFHPFMWAWIAYLAGLIVLVANQMSAQTWSRFTAFAFLYLGFALHLYGMLIRSYIAGRPPVTNMYETVVWVPWASVLFGFILERFKKDKLLLMAASSVAVLCLILTDLAPTVLDKSIHPLEPVLRSNFWLLTHVLIINLGYAAFFLAFALGDVLLFLFLKDEKRFAQTIQTGAHSIYRSLQIGVVLLAAGTILGGVWADYSWGRFWGWDPKETWALISLLGYLALLHGRLVGWVKNFELAAGAVVTFSLIIMAWYGVNFVLGAGLHSYGFGAGGVEYVSGFVVVHILYVAYVSTVRYQRLKNQTR